jgi:peptidoglycan L-alanyl-D-glutamate endopeptidase CwlK
LGKSLTITNGYRSTEKQNKLYCKGRPNDEFCVKNQLSTNGKIVTTKKGGCSKHNFKEAFDVYFTKPDGSPDLKTSMTDDVAKIGEELGLEWGGRWKNFTDKPHFQTPGSLCK